MPDPLFYIRLRWRGVRTQIMDAGASRAPTDNGLLAPEFGRRPRAREERAKSIGVRSLKQALVLSNAPDITTTTAARPRHHRLAPRLCAAPVRGGGAHRWATASGGVALHACSARGWRFAHPDADGRFRRQQPVSVAGLTAVGSN